MPATKDQLLQMADSKTQTVSLNGIGDVVIRRLKLKERNELLKGRGTAQDLDSGLELTRQLIVKGMVDPVVTIEDVDQFAAATADAIAKAILDFNGWTKEGQAAIADHFSPAS